MDPIIDYGIHNSSLIKTIPVANNAIHLHPNNYIQTAQSIDTELQTENVDKKKLVLQKNSETLKTFSSFDEEINSAKDSQKKNTDDEEKETEKAKKKERKLPVTTPGQPTIKNVDDWSQGPEKADQIKTMRTFNISTPGQVRDYGKLVGDRKFQKFEEVELDEFKKMIVTIKDPVKRRKAMDDIKRFGKKTGFRIDKMSDGKSFRIDGKGADLNKFATDMKNFYGAEIKAESVEEQTDLEEFTDKQIERLRKEYQSLKGKESGINPEKFKKLRGMMMRFPKANLLKLVKADIPVLTTGAKAALVMYHGMKWKQLPEDFLPYIDLFADDNKELSEVKKGKFKEVDPKVIDRIEKMMRGSRDEKNSIANMLNYFMPPEVVDMVRYKLKIVPKRGKIKF